MRIYKSKLGKIFISMLSVCCVLGNISAQTVLADEPETVVLENTNSETGIESTTVAATVAYPELPEIYGKAAILMDMDTGAILYEKNAYETMYPASITKIMTGLLTVENCALDDMVTYSADAINSLPWDASRYGVVAGETVSVKDSLHMLILSSANEVAIGLAQHISGSESEFAKLMTERAKQAGALNTNFVNASGLHDDNHYTTAYDMAMITKAALGNPTFAKVLCSSTYTISPTNKVDSSNQIWHTHRMLVNTREAYYKYAKGGKTGYTDEAGRTLVTYASKDGMNLICVVLFSDTDNVCKDTKTLFEYGFNNFTKVNAANEETRFGQSDESFFIANKELFQYSGKLMEFSSSYITIPKDTELSQMGYSIEYDVSSADETVAVVKYYIDEHYLGSATLTLNTQTDKTVGLVPDKEPDTTEYVVKEELPINIWWILGGIVGLITIILIIVILRKTKEKRKVKKERKKMFKNKNWHV